MKKTKSKFAFLGLIIAVVTMFSLALSSQGITIQAYASSEYSYAEQRVFSNAVIEDDFADDKVLVVLNRQETLRFKSWSIKDFAEVDLVAVEDLTSSATEILDVNLNRQKFAGTRKLGETKSLAETEINADEFRTVLMLTLREPSKQNVLDAIKQLEKRKDIISAEPDYILQSHTTSPNDTFYSEGRQWALNGTNGINAPLAWSFTAGTNTVRVGVIDTGIDAAHPEFQNSNGTARVNVGLSRNFAAAPPYTVTSVTDTNGHGTHVAGIIGAVGNNGLGVTGVAQNIELVSLQLGSGPHDQFASRLVQAVTHAGANGIRIVNNSNGTDNFSGTVNSIISLENAIRGYNGLFVTSAGNGNRNNDANPSRFPSNINLPNLIAVGAIASNGARASYSNWGATTVDIFAPGGDEPRTNTSIGILSTWPTALTGNVGVTGYRGNCGTSMAAPQVAGIAALMLSVNPYLTGSQLKAAIMNNSDVDTRYTNDPIHGQLCVSGGRANAYKAVAAAAFTTSSTTGGISITGLSAGFTFSNNTNLTLPDNFAPLSNKVPQVQQAVTTIGASAFSGCSQINQISIPASVSNIGNDAFSYCTNLNTVYLNRNSAYGSVTNIGTGVFDSCHALERIYVTDISSQTAYRNAFRWSDFQEKVYALNTWLDLSLYDVHKIDNYFNVFTDEDFIISPMVSGTYDMVAMMDIYYYGINVSITDVTNVDLETIYEFADDGYGMVSKTIDLKAGRYYIVDIYGDYGSGFFDFTTQLKFTLQSESFV